MHASLAARLSWICAGLMIASVGAISWADAPSADGFAEKELVDAATQSYRSALASYETRTVTREEAYRGSYRWMQAELRAPATPATRAKAIEAHLGRLREMQKHFYSYEACSDLAYYMTEAELLLRDADPRARARLDQQALARRELQGRWQRLDGDDSGDSWDSIVISGRILSKCDSDSDVGQSVGLIDVDPAQSPKWIDIFSRNECIDMEYAGIYQLVDGVLSICWAGPRNERPRKFSSAGGNNLVRYKRIPPAK